MVRTRRTVGNEQRTVRLTSRRGPAIAANGSGDRLRGEAHAARDCDAGDSGYGPGAAVRRGGDEGAAADGPRVDVPGVGPARVVEAHWECVAYYTRTVEFGFPFAGTTKKSCVQVLYIDKHTIQADAK